MPSDPLVALIERLARVRDLHAAAAVLEWDQETYMPEGAAEARALQVGTLRELAHELFVADEVGALLDAAAPAVRGLAPDSLPAALVRVTRHDWERAVRLPSALVADLASTSARAKQAWKEARETDTFARFAPHLRRLVDLTRVKAEAVGYAAVPYDALLDEFDPGLTTAQVTTVFADLRRELVPIVAALAERPAPDDAFLRERWDPDAQWAFTLRVLEDVGYRFEHGRQDRSAHPFTTAFSTRDVRVTTRIHERFFPAGLFGSLHEAGHALYEQGIDAAYDRTPLAEGTSLSVHESQSRLWENQVGRGRAFWRHYFGPLRNAFPEPLAGVDEEAFYRAINRVSPSLIRVEADEVTYNLHIMLRFELETALFAGEMEVDALPAAWNDRMEAYLGLRPETDADGVLQDVHWSLGAFGYFPTYALGTLLSAQLYAAAGVALPDLEAHHARGAFAPLLGWLRTHVHRWGRARSAADLLSATTGGGLDARPWLAYVREKYGAIYGAL